MPIEAAIYLKLYYLKNVKQVLLRPMMLLVTSYCLTIKYDGQIFRPTYKSLINHVQKYYVSFTLGAYAPYTPCISTPLRISYRCLMIY